MEIGFINQQYLYFLLLIPLAIFGLYRLRLSHLKKLQLLGVNKNKNTWTAVGIPSIILSLLILAIARPYNGYEDIKVPFVGKDYAVVMDISLSMMAKDVSPNRLEFAKRKIEDLIRKIEKDSYGDRVSITLFAGESYLYCPLTADYNVLRQFANSISTELITSTGSAIADAIHGAIISFKNTNAQFPKLILITDGEDDALNVKRVIDLLKENNISIIILGIGTIEGSPIELPNGSFIRDASGNVVISKLSEDNLKAIAAESGGMYYRASSSGAEINAITAKEVSLETKTLSEGGTVRSYNELSSYIILSVLIIIFLLFITKKFEAILVLFLIITCAQISIAEESVTKITAHGIKDGVQAYDKGEFEEAIKIFQYNLNKDPYNRKLQEALAHAYFKAGKNKEAISSFGELAISAKNGREKFYNLYDLGNSYLQNKQFDEAIAAYEEALKIKEGDEKTSHNLEVAKKLQEVEQQQEQEKQQKQEQNENKEEENKDNKQEQNDKKEQQQGEQQEQENQESDQDKQKDDKENQNEEEQQSNSNDEKESEEKQDKSENEGNEEQVSNQSEEQTSNNSDGQPKEYDEVPLNVQEAKTWLDSLPEEPLLLQQKRGKTDYGKQYW